jgi:type IV secretory pathway VirB10-like protein
MPDQFTNSATVPTPTPAPEPLLQNKIPIPKGVLQNNLKMLVYLGAAGVLIAASILSSKGKQPVKAGTKGGPPQPFVQDTTDNNVQALRSQVEAERAKQQQDAALAAAMGTGANRINPLPGARYRPGTNLAADTQPGQGSYVTNANPEMQQLTPVQQEEMQIASKDRELAHSSLFSSSIAYSRSQQQSEQQQHQQGEAQPQSGQPGPDQSAAQNTTNVQHQRPSNLVDPRASGEPAVEPAGYKRPVEANIDSATGQPYLIYEGTFLDTVLMNRLDGDSSGPVKVLVSNPLYSHDHQHVIIPDGTVVLGEAKKIGAAGFGQQRRMAVVFHRLIMPDGYSVDLDQFHGLDQIGEEGLKDKVNNHYLQIFGTSIALGIIAGAGEITAGGGTITTSGSQAFTNGAAGGVSQSASTILDRFIQIPPTITIREGHRVKVYFSQDLLLPAYENHTVPQTF